MTCYIICIRQATLVQQCTNQSTARLNRDNPRRRRFGDIPDAVRLPNSAPDRSKPPIHGRQIRRDWLLARIRSVARLSLVFLDERGGIWRESEMYDLAVGAGWGGGRGRRGTANRLHWITMLELHHFQVQPPMIIIPTNSLYVATGYHNLSRHQSSGGSTHLYLGWLKGWRRMC